MCLGPKDIMKNSTIKTLKISKREGFTLEKSFNVFCGQIKPNIGEIPSFLHMGFDSLF